MPTQIKIYSNIQDLTGIGEEWLINPLTQDVIAVFIDGDLRCKVLSLDFKLKSKGNEVTKIVI